MCIITSSSWHGSQPITSNNNFSSRGALMQQYRSRRNGRKSLPTSPLNIVGKRHLQGGKRSRRRRRRCEEIRDNYLPHKRDSGLSRPSQRLCLCVVSPSFLVLQALFLRLKEAVHGPRRDSVSGLPWHRNWGQEAQTSTKYSSWAKEILRRKRESWW